MIHTQILINFIEVVVAVLLQNVNVFGILFPCFLCFIQIAMYLGEIGVEQNVMDNFLIEMIRSCPIFGLLLLMLKIF